MITDNMNGKNLDINKKKNIKFVSIRSVGKMLW